MSTCLSHLGTERGLMISGSTEPAEEYSTQLERLFGPAKAPGKPVKKPIKKVEK